MRCTCACASRVSSVSGRLSEHSLGMMVKLKLSFHYESSCRPGKLKDIAANVSKVRFQVSIMLQQWAYPLKQWAYPLNSSFPD